MLFSTDYPIYQDPIGDEHDSRPHLLLHAMQKMAEYVGDFFAALFVIAFTGMEIVFLMALGALLVQGLLSWDGLQDVIQSAGRSWQAWAE